MNNNENVQKIRQIYRFDFFCTFKVKGAKGWRSAQATAGGVSLEELNMETMESRKVKGLFFAGEIIDYDGPCGGYNLQNAWETGIKAGKAMVSNV